jgi:hypothetical protein
LSPGSPRVSAGCGNGAVGLLNVEDVRRAEPNHGSRLVVIAVVWPPGGDRRPDRDALFAFADLATQYPPSVESGNARCGRSLRNY